MMFTYGEMMLPPTAANKEDFRPRRKSFYYNDFVGQGAPAVRLLLGVGYTFLTITRDGIVYNTFGRAGNYGLTKKIH